MPDLIRALLSLAIVGLLMTAASAQIKVKDQPKEAPSEGAIKRQKADAKSRDSDYNAALNRLPDQKFDPWRDMRGSGK